MSRYLFLSIFISIAISSYSQDINENIKTHEFTINSIQKGLRFLETMNPPYVLKASSLKELGKT